MKDEDLFSKRYGMFKGRVDLEIKKIEQICERYGGVEFIKTEMVHVAITTPEYAQYCAKIMRSNFQLPKVTTKKDTENKDKSRGRLRGQLRSEMKISPQCRSSSSSVSHLPKVSSSLLGRSGSTVGRGDQYNKWYMNPEKRFKGNQMMGSKYDWKGEKFILNILKRRNVELSHPKLAGFIARVQEQTHRQPVLCSYAKIN